MYQPRTIATRPDWLDEDGLKLYTISHSGKPVEHAPYLQQLALIKQSRPVDWPDTPAFAIFHDGATARYLVLIYWGNDNELFPIVCVDTGAGWVVAPETYSFCLWDLEVIWEERALYIRHCYSGSRDLPAYRASRPSGWASDTPG